jgi:hypothetical protein
MKKSILFLALCLFLTNISFAGKKRNALPTSGFSIIQNGPVVKVLYKSNSAGNVRISIIDAHKHKVFSETLKHTESFSRPYNIGSLPHGQYVVTIDDGAGSLSQVVSVEEKTTSKTFKISKVFGVKDKVLLTVGRYAKGFELKIVDENGRTVYSEAKELNEDFAQVYNLAALKGDVSIFITDNYGNEEKFIF